ncbi:hypothetical protein V1525DRAFT_391860 [Lipomyces kononenkoae]|uniref:Uncharacterized protein n=1 Tax=Lipomyces kononenkoae TaxID=34357 RepID=A0ACC3SQZ5_LIPKO
MKKLNGVVDSSGAVRTLCAAQSPTELESCCHTQIFAVASLVYLWLYLPDTAGRWYEDLDELFMQRISARAFKNYRTDVEKKERKQQ